VPAFQKFTPEQSAETTLGSPFPFLILTTTPDFSHTAYTAAAAITGALHVDTDEEGRETRDATRAGDRDTWRPAGSTVTSSGLPTEALLDPRCRPLASSSQRPCLVSSHSMSSHPSFHPSFSPLRFALSRPSLVATQLAPRSSHLTPVHRVRQRPDGPITPSCRPPSLSPVPSFTTTSHAPGAWAWRVSAPIDGPRSHPVDL
jgi:hypothetical protein